MPVLVVVRHAKAANPPATADPDRPLSERGRADARAAGAWLREHVGSLDRVVASPALRVSETVEGLLAAYDRPPPVVREPDLYAAELDDVLAVLRDLDDGDATVALVGHNPASSELVRALTGVDTRLKTCGTAVVRLPGRWADTAPDAGELVTTATPRAQLGGGPVGG